MAVQLQTLELVKTMVEACNEAEAWSCRAMARGQLQVPRRPGWQTRGAGGGKAAQRYSTTVMDSRNSKQVKMIAMCLRGLAALGTGHWELG
jgi:hypothetical protein